MPKTKLGKWAAGLLAVFVVLLIVLVFGGNFAGWRPGDPPSKIVGASMVIAGIAAFVTGVVSLIKFKDRSFGVILAVIMGLIAVLITIMEVAEGISWRLTH